MAQIASTRWLWCLIQRLFCDHVYPVFEFHFTWARNTKSNDKYCVSPSLLSLAVFICNWSLAFFSLNLCSVCFIQLMVFKTNFGWSGQMFVFSNCTLFDLFTYLLMAFVAFNGNSVSHWLVSFRSGGAHAYCFSWWAMEKTTELWWGVATNGDSSC